MIVSPDCDTTHSAGDTLSKIQLYEFLDHPTKMLDLVYR